MADSSPVVSSGAQGVMGKREKDLLSSPFLSPPPAPASAVCVTFFFFFFGGGGSVYLFVCFLFFLLKEKGCV